jgi:hypothetical protein
MFYRVNDFIVTRISSDSHILDRSLSLRLKSQLELTVGTLDPVLFEASGWPRRTYLHLACRARAYAGGIRAVLACYFAKSDEMMHYQRHPAHHGKT